MFWGHVLLSLTPLCGGLGPDHHPSQRTGGGGGTQTHRQEPAGGKVRGLGFQLAPYPTCCDLGSSLRLPGLGFLPPCQEGEEAPAEAHAARGSRAVTWPRSPQPRATAPELWGAQADRSRVTPSQAPHRRVLGWGPARGGPGAPRLLTRGPRRLGPGAGGGASAGVLLLCERRRLGFAKVNSVSSSSSRRLFLL